MIQQLSNLDSTTAMSARYDQIGLTYANKRQPDPRIAAQIEAALGDVRSVVNVGAGTGSYEPPSLDGIAIEPSAVMISQRPPTAFPVIQARAEKLPLADRCVDAVMAVMTLHHWTDVALGLTEMQRVARRTVMIMTYDPDHEGFWLDDYLPGRRDLDRNDMPSIDWIKHQLGSIEVQAIPVPFDCEDGFYGAYWRRPEAYLDPSVRNSISVFSRLDEVDCGLASLQSDLETGLWESRYGSVRKFETLDVGYRLLIARLN